MNNQNNSPYYSLSTFLKDKFGTKIAKISIDGGFTCPNRDGTISTNGCIFCSQRGSGDFATSSLLPIKEQVEQGKNQTKEKWKNVKYIVYFQAYTNTYSTIQDLRQKYYDALSCDDVVGIAIATRPDCLTDEVLDLLEEINQKTYLWVELGFQSSNQSTIKLINRGYDNTVFEESIKRLNQKNIHVVVHVILGLPYEDSAQMIDTVKYVSNFSIQGIKIHSLHILKDTALNDLFTQTPFNIMTLEEYVETVIKCLEYLPKNIVIHRLTGDGAKSLLVEPQWSLNKRNILNSINKKMATQNRAQGDLYQGT